MFSSLQLRPTSFIKALSILCIFIVVISYSYWDHPANIKAVFTHLKPTPAQTQQPEKLADHGWTQNIWQTSKYPAGYISNKNEKYMETWPNLNPGYQHKLLTDELIAEYVREHFHASNPDIEETFLQAKDLVLKLDLIKYLLLWAEGGVYSDLDVACIQPLSQWVPPHFIDKAGIVLGMQMEQKTGRDGNIKDTFQLADWTIMSKPNQPFLWFLYQSLGENIKQLAAAEQIVPTVSESRAYEVEDVTGRNALTQAFLAYATSVTGTEVTGNNFTRVKEPRLFGEILVLPVKAFASSPRWNGRGFVHHYEAGSWKAETWEKLEPSLNQKQKEKDREKIDAVENEKNVEAGKQKQEDMENGGGDQNLEESKLSENNTTTNHNTSNSNNTAPLASQTLDLTLEQQSAAAAAIATQISQAHEKAKEAEKEREKEEEERIAEEREKPQWAPLKEKGKVGTSNNLKDYVDEGGETVGEGEDELGEGRAGGKTLGELFGGSGKGR